MKKGFSEMIGMVAALAAITLCVRMIRRSEPITVELMQEYIEYCEDSENYEEAFFANELLNKLKVGQYPPELNLYEVKRARRYAQMVGQNEDGDLCTYWEVLRDKWIDKKK